jgi:hypothetical protein
MCHCCSGSIAIMYCVDLSDRVKALQRELVEIAAHNRQYFTRKMYIRRAVCKVNFKHAPLSLSWKVRSIMVGPFAN